MNKAQTQAARLARLLPAGVPRYVRAYDNGGESFDRYTVAFTGRAGVLRVNGCDPEYSFRAMSANPCHPQGFGQWGSVKGQPVDTLGEVNGKVYWPPAIGRKVAHLGKRIAFAELPEECRKLILSDYRAIWSLDTAGDAGKGDRV
jgi:hypothetical protein